MSYRKIGNIKLMFNKNDSKTADLVADACEKSLRLAAEDWGLKPPADCRIYVMTSWPGFIMNSTPLRWKLMLLPTIPLWMPRIKRTWPYSAAWTQRYGSRIAIGIKPSRLLEKSDRSIGTRMFYKEENPDFGVQTVTCHELIHACSAHLVLPMWLNEGIAILSTDNFAGKQTIRTDTLQLVKDYTPKKDPPTYGELSQMKAEAISYHDSRAYWLVRYLKEKYPDILKPVLSRHMFEDEIEKRITGELGLEPGTLWTLIDDIVTGFFTEKHSK